MHASPKTQQQNMHSLTLAQLLITCCAQCRDSSRTAFSAACPYKAALCWRWVASQTCRFGARCHFAHGQKELQAGLAAAGFAEKRLWDASVDVLCWLLMWKWAWLTVANSSLLGSICGNLLANVPGKKLQAGIIVWTSLANEQNRSLPIWWDWRWHLMPWFIWWRSVQISGLLL